MKTTQTLLGKYQNPTTKDEYLVVEIKDFDRIVNRLDHTERPLVRCRYETFNGDLLELVGSLSHPRFRMASSGAVLELTGWPH